VTARPDGVMHDQHAEVVALRQDPYPVDVDMASRARRDVMNRILSLAANLGGEATTADMRTILLAVLSDAERDAAASVDPYAYLGSVASGVLMAGAELGVMPS